MIRAIVILFCFFLCTTTFSKETPTEVEKLAMTCKVWGFLKYYHPQVATGKYNWDAALINFLPYTRKSETWEELNGYAFTSILSLGSVPKCETCDEINPNWFDKNFDLSWTDDLSKLSRRVVELLNYIEFNRNQEKCYYTQNKLIYEIDASNELVYQNQVLPSVEFRILDLFRYWNIVEYFFPYKYLMDDHWDTSLVQMIPAFMLDSDAVSYHLTIMRLAAKLNDGHAIFQTDLTEAFLGNYILPIKTTMVDSSVIIFDFYNDSLALLNGFKIGDLITHVGGVAVKDLLRNRWELIPASNEVAKLHGFQRHLRHSQDRFVRLTLVRSGTEIEVVSEAYELNNLNLSNPKGKYKWEILSGNIGYVNMGELEMTNVKSMMNELHGTKTIIFDQRNYPNETIDEIMKYLNHEAVPAVSFIVPNYKYPGFFLWRKPEYKSIKLDSSKIKQYNGSIVVLVDEKTQSQGEWTTMCFQTYSKCKVIGSQTAGADGNMAAFKTVGGYDTYISGIGVFYPDGRLTQRIGIIPDIFFAPTLKGLSQGRDELLEYALELYKD